MVRDNYFDDETRENDPSLEAVRTYERFFGFSSSLPLEYDEEYLYLCGSILKDKDIARFFNFRFGLVSRSYLRDSLEVYDKLGIALHNVNLANKKVKSEKDLENLDSDELLELIQLSNPGEIPIHFQPCYGGKTICILFR